MEKCPVVLPRFSVAVSVFVFRLCVYLRVPWCKLRFRGFPFLCVIVCAVDFPLVCVIFVPIVFDLCRWKVHSTRDPRLQKTVGKPSARQVISVFTWVLECYFHPQVTRPCVYKCARFDVKSHMRGVYHMLLVDPCQWKRPRGVERDPGRTWCTGPLVGTGHFVAVRPLVVVRPSVAVRPLVAARQCRLHVTFWTVSG